MVSADGGVAIGQAGLLVWNSRSILTVIVLMSGGQNGPQQAALALTDPPEAAAGMF